MGLSTFWHRLGDHYNDFEKWEHSGQAAQAVGGAFGKAWTAANNAPVLGTGIHATEALLGATGEALHKPYEQVARGVSSLAQVTAGAEANAEQMGGGYLNQRIHAVTGIFDGDSWNKAWNNSSTVSAGQALTASLIQNHTPFARANTSAQALVDPKQAELRDQFYNHTWAGRGTSGAFDLAANLTLDPLIVGGKLVTATRAARTVLKPGVVDDALRFATGESNKAQVGRAAARKGKIIQRNWFHGTEGSIPELMASPLIQKFPDAAPVVLMLHTANKIEDEAARNLVKGDILGAMAGRQVSIERLKSSQPSLATRAHRLMSPPEQGESALRFSHLDGGQAQLDFNNMPDKLAELDDYDDEIRAIYARVGDQINYAPVTHIGTTLPERAKGAFAAKRVRETILIDGPASRPVRYLHGAFGARISSHVDTDDAVAGYETLQESLAKANWLPASTRQQYLERWVKAPDKESRNQVIWNLKEHYLTAAGEAHGLTREEVKFARDTMNNTFQKHRTQLETQLFSAADGDKIPKLIGPDGEALAYDGPWAQTMVARTVYLDDPKHIDDAIRSWKANGVFDEIRASKNGKVSANVQDVLDKTMNAWKFAALFRGAYPMRVQVDTQLRNLAAMGFLDYFASAGRGVSNTVKNTVRAEVNPALDAATREADRAVAGLDDQIAKLAPKAAADPVAARRIQELQRQKSVALSRAGSVPKTIRRGDSSARSTDLRRSEVVKSAGGQEFDVATARTFDELNQQTRQLDQNGGTLAQILSDGTSRVRAQLLANGGFEKVMPNDPNWATSYKRAVNAQFLKSPAVMHVIRNADDADAVRAIRADPKAMAELKQLNAAIATPEEYVAHARPRVDHLLPNDELKAIVSGDGGRPSRTAEQAPPSFTERTQEPHPEGEPAWEGQTPLYHGTSKRFKDDTVDPYGGNAPSDNLFGFGFYSTDSREIADSYTKKGRGQTPHTYGVKWAGRGKPRVLDLSTSHDPHLREFISRQLGEEGLDRGLELYADDHARLTSMLGDKSVSDEKLLHEWRLAMGEVGIAKYHVDDVYADLASEMRDKYDVLQHQGGQYRGNGETPHRVNMFIDPSKIEVSSAPVGGVTTRELRAEGPARPPVVLDPAIEATGGRELTNADIKKYFDNTDQRMPVHGEGYHLMYSSSPAVRSMKALRDGWYHLASDAPERVMGRHPLFNKKFRDHMKASIAHIEDGVSISSAQELAMRRNAARLARRDVADTLFDLTRQANGTTWFRHMSPFISAWEDTMKKWGGLFYENPARIAYGNEMWRSPNNALPIVDSEGNRVDADGKTYDKNGKRITDKNYRGDGQFVVLPKVMGLRGSDGGALKIDKSSANLVFQGQQPWLPGFGPLVQVPVNEFVKDAFYDQADNPIMKLILPYGVDQTPLALQPLPAWIKKAIPAFADDSARYSQLYATFWKEQAIKHDKDPQHNWDPAAKGGQRRVSRMVRNQIIKNALLSNTAPVSTQQDYLMQFYVDQGHQYKAKDAQYREAHAKWIAAGGEPGTEDEPPVDSDAAFKQDYPEYYTLAVGISTNNTGINATAQVAPNSRRFKHEIADDRFTKYGWAIVGADNLGGDFSQGVYSHQLTNSVGDGNSTKFRSKATGLEAVHEAQRRDGWLEYNKVQTQLNLVLESRGGISEGSNGAADVRALKQQFVEYLQTKNPSWFADYKDQNSGTVPIFLGSMRQLIKETPAIAKRDDFRALQDYMSARDVARGLLAQRKASGGNGGLNSQGNEDLAQLWGQYTSYLVQNSLGFEQMWNRVLSHDDLTAEVS